MRKRKNMTRKLVFGLALSVNDCGGGYFACWD